MENEILKGLDPEAVEKAKQMLTDRDRMRDSLWAELAMTQREPSKHKQKREALKKALRNLGAEVSHDL